MSEDWISVTEAVTRAALAGIPNSEDALDDAIEHGKVRTRIVEAYSERDPNGALYDIPDIPLYAGGIIIADMEHDERMREVLLPPSARKREVSLASLFAWIANLKGSQPVKQLPKPTPKRPKGTGYDKVDEPLVEEMRDLIQAGKASSVQAAAKLVADRAAGGGDFNSKVTRLTKRYKTENNGE